MANSEFPWFKFLARDALTDVRWQTMPAIARGVYIQFLAYQWENNGLPADLESLSSLAGLARRECFVYSASEDPLTPLQLFEEVWPWLADFFPLCDDDRCRRNQKLEEQRCESYAIAMRRKKSGKKAAKIRWRKHREQKRLDTTALRSQCPTDAILDADAEKKEKETYSG